MKDIEKQEKELASCKADIVDNTQSLKQANLTEKKEAFHMDTLTELRALQKQLLESIDRNQSDLKELKKRLLFPDVKVAKKEAKSVSSYISTSQSHVPSSIGRFSVAVDDDSTAVSSSVLEGTTPMSRDDLAKFCLLDQHPRTLHYLRVIPSAIGQVR